MRWNDTYWALPAPHMFVVFLLLVSLNVFQFIRNWRVTSLISLLSRTTKKYKILIEILDLKQAVNIINVVFR